MKLELYGYQDDNLQTLLHKAAQARTFLGMVKDAQGEIDATLASEVSRLSQETGTAFTARHEGWSALLTDPQPKAHITDRNLFEGWFMSDGDRLMTLAWRSHVEVLDHETAYHFVSAWAEGQEVRSTVGVFRASVVPVFPADPIETLTKDFGFVVTGGVLVCAATGEVAQGVTVTQGTPHIMVTGKPEAKKRLRAELHAQLGMKEIEA